VPREDERLATGVVHLRDGVKLRAVDDDEVRLETSQGLGVELAQEHVASDMLCQAVSVMTRSSRRYSGSAPT